MKLLIPTNGAPFFAYLLLLFLISKPYLLLGDGGTCRHVITGQYIIANHSIPKTNYVFALNPNAPWQTHELLSDLVFGGAQNWLGVNGTDLAAAIAISLALTWSFQFGRMRGLGVISGLLLLIVTMFTTSIHWSARAHLLSYVPFLMLYYLAFLDRSRPLLRGAVILITMCAWANLHGSYVLGLVMLLLLALDSLLKKDNSIKLTAALLLCGLAGSLFNIRGAEFFQYVFSYATNAHTRMHNVENHRLDFATGGYPVITFLVLGALVLGSISVTRQKTTWTTVCLAILLFVGGITSMRLIPYFALIALPALGPAWQTLSLLGAAEQAPANHEKYPSSDHSWLSKFFHFEQRLAQQESGDPRKYLKLYAASIVGLVLWLTIPFFKMPDYDPARLPVDAITWLEKNPQQGLGFNPDNWGDYIYMRTKKPVFIDDKGDFYSDAFIEDYIAIYTASSNWRSTADRYKLHWLLLRNDLPLVQQMSQMPDWQKIYCDQLTTIYALKDKAGSP